MTNHASESSTKSLFEQAGRAARRKVQHLLDERHAGSANARKVSAAPTTPDLSPARSTPQRTAVARPLAAARLSPSMALRENGFTVFRGLFTNAECARLADDLKREAGITGGKKYMRVDATNNFDAARDLLFEGRIIEAVRSALGERPRYLQVGDLHYLHDTAGWHRDSVHRAHDASEAPDWRAGGSPFGVVKAIVYLESDNAAMGIMAGSHATPQEMDREHVKALEAAGQQIVIDADGDPNLRLTADQKTRPLAWKAEVGDVLVFDERMYHAGRRVDNGKVTANREAAKFTLSLVFGLDNEHSERMYSYFRYVRAELSYRDLDESLRAELDRRGLVLSQGWGDFYRDHPDDLRHVHVQGATTMDDVRARYGLVETG